MKFSRIVALAVAVAIPEIARAQPPVSRERLDGFFGALVVAAHHLFAAHDDFACLVRRAFASLAIDDLRLGAGRQAHAADPPPLRFVWIGEYRRRGLRHSHRLDDADPETRLERPVMLGRECRRRAAAESERRQVQTSRLVGVEQVSDDGGDDVDPRAPGTRRLAPERARGKARRHDDGACVIQRREERHDQAIDVVKRQRCQHAIVGA